MITLKEVTELLTATGVFLTGVASLIKVLENKKKPSVKNRKPKNK